MSYITGAEGYKGITPGHEICGEVLEVGAEADDCPHKPGDMVVVYPWTGCRDCEYCHAAKSQSCRDNKVSTTDIGRGYDGRKHGGFQEMFPLEEWHFALSLPASIPPHIGCMLPCSGITTYVGLLKCQEPLRFGAEHRGGGKLLILGLGGLGSWALIIAKLMYGENVQVTCADVSQDKLDAARKMGADHTVLLSTADTVDEMSSKFIAHSGKLDACVDLVGFPNTIRACFLSVQNEGNVVVLGLAGGSLQLPTPTMVGRSISLLGSRTGSIKHVQDLIQLVAEKGLRNEPPLEFVGLDAVNDVFARMKVGKVNGRAIIKM